MIQDTKKNLDKLPIIKATKEVLLAGAPIFPNLSHNGLSHQLEARAQHDCLNDLECVNHKTLIVGGTYDLIAPKANLVKLHEAIRNSRLEFFEGGHLFLIQDDRAWPVITSFLSEESDSLEKVSNKLKNMDAKTPLIVLYGGNSPEHDVSRSSALHVVKAIDLNRYETYLIAIDQDGSWYSFLTISLLKSNLTFRELFQLKEHSFTPWNIFNLSRTASL